MALAAHQEQFIDFLVKSGALTFGDFTTKSGRKTPYFVNTGRFDTGEKISQLGIYYAAHIMQTGLRELSTVFGPAYKGIPLAVSTASSLFTKHNKNVGFSFDRKEVKDHGDGGLIVGQPIVNGSKIVLVEDVITAGTTLRAVIPLLNQLAKVEILGTVISVDRCEKGTGHLSAVQEVESTLGVKVYPIVTIHQIKQYLAAKNNSGLVLTPDLTTRIESYLEQYGA